MTVRSQLVRSRTTTVLSPSTANSTNASASTCHAGVRYNTDGTEKGEDAAGVWNVDRGNWLDFGVSSNVWVERAITGDPLSDHDPGAGRHQLNTDRLFGNLDPLPGGAPENSSVKFDFYDASSGGNLLATVTITIESDRV